LLARANRWVSLGGSQDREHSTVLGRHRIQLELVEDAAEVLLDRCWADHEGFGDATVGLAFGHRGEHVAFAWAESVEGSFVLAAAKHPRDDLRIQRGPAFGDAGYRVDEALDCPHPLFEEIADSLGVVSD
jgi:hypothetical protein